MKSFFKKVYLILKFRKFKPSILQNKTNRKNELNLDHKYDFVVILTQFKRENLALQLEAIKNQTKKPDLIIVFQNELHVDIEELKELYDFHHVQNTFNTKYFGRFSYCLNFNANSIIIMDDDIVPGPYCFESYINQMKSLDAIVGGNGRIAEINPNKDKLYHPPDIGIRPKSILVDFVGHLWCFKHEWIHKMFTIKPLTLQTGEDMHFCFSLKLASNISSYTGSQKSVNECCDTCDNVLGTDDLASYKITKNDTRIDVEKYFANNGLNFIKEN